LSSYGDLNFVQKLCTLNLNKRSK